MPLTPKTRKPKTEAPKTEAPKKNRSGRPIGIYLPPDLVEALDKHLDHKVPRTSKTAIIEMMLYEYLRREGALPPL